ncbi:MAG: YdcF family protein [Pseudomonadota bacterium]|nr:YdcF family protein [Pseudomonadota bacterium]
MKFALSKILSLLIHPAHLLLLALLAGLWFLRPRSARPRAGRFLVFACTASLFLLGLAPVCARIAGPLENRFPVPEISGSVDGIVVLAGFLSPWSTEGRGQFALNGNAERLVELVSLMHRFPKAKVVFTGGSGSLMSGDIREADAVRQILNDMGVDTRRIIFERESRTTYENVMYSKALADPQPEEKWLLVTSAMHIPRAVGVFRQQGWPVTAWPCDYQTPAPGTALRPDFAVLRGLVIASLAVHEYAGLVSYYLSGYTAQLLPSP